MTNASSLPPLIVGIGGTVVGPSSTERALSIAMAAVEREGFRTRIFGGEAMARLPLYDPRVAERTADDRTFVEAVREASGLTIASPSYHGSISGLVNNALDLLEEAARDDDRPYLADMPVGLIATAYGGQATGSTIAALRSVVHALRGWPTPFAASINSRYEIRLRGRRERRLSYRAASPDRPPSSPLCPARRATWTIAADLNHDAADNRSPARSSRGITASVNRVIPFM